MNSITKLFCIFPHSYPFLKNIKKYQIFQFSNTVQKLFQSFVSFYKFVYEFLPQLTPYGANAFLEYLFKSKNRPMITWKGSVISKWVSFVKCWTYFQGKNLVGGNNELVNSLLGALSGMFQVFSFTFNTWMDLCQHTKKKIIASGMEIKLHARSCQETSCIVSVLS